MCGNQRAARDIAAEYFDAEKVFHSLMESGLGLERSLQQGPGHLPGVEVLFLAHLNLAPGPDIPGPRPSPTTPPPPRNPRQAPQRRCPITGSTQPPGPRSAPLPPPLTTAGFRAHHSHKESAPNDGAGRAADGRAAGECHGALGEAPEKAAFRYDSHSR